MISKQNSRLESSTSQQLYSVIFGAITCDKRNTPANMAHMEKNNTSTNILIDSTECGMINLNHDYQKYTCVQNKMCCLNKQV